MSLTDDLSYWEGFTVGAARADAARRDGKPVRVFDWDKAARLIRERSPKVAEAGLSGDWNCTAGQIFADGKPVPAGETYTYLASPWATPMLDLDGERVECWMTEADAKPREWHAGTYWPQSSLAILHGEAVPQ